MPLKEINKLNIKIINDPDNEVLSETDMINSYNFSETYIFYIEGYSLLSKTGFIKIEIGYGNCINECIFYAYDKIKNNILENFNIVIDDLMIKDYKLYNKDSDTQPTGFSFYPLTNDIIQKFKEDHEIHMMSLEDK